LEKIRVLEGQLKEQESFKGEISVIREQMEESKREMDLLLAGSRGRQFSRRIDDDDDADDDDQSVVTLMDDEDAEERVRERRRLERESRRTDRPSTPEPGHLNGDAQVIPLLSSAAHGTVGPNAELVARIQALSTEISEAVALSRTLQTQHNEAMTAVKLLTERVGELESGIASKVTEEVTKAEQRWNTWRINLEEGWKRERESWEAERERLRGVVRDWEEASRRAHEEEEDRELNERLSEDELVDEEEDEDAGDAAPDGWDKDVLDIPNGLALSPSRLNGKPRRRRPSSRAILAVKALKGVTDEAGASTPKQGPQAFDEGRPRRTATSRAKRAAKSDNALARSGSASTFNGDKESSESGKESGDTLRDKDLAKKVKRERQRSPVIEVRLTEHWMLTGSQYQSSLSSSWRRLLEQFTIASPRID
jgi:hypothetical protein